MAGLGLPILTLLLACGPYHGWPDATEVFPYVTTPETDLPPWEEVRWETEAYDPSDPTFVGLYLRKAVEHRKSAPPEVLEHFDAMRAQIPALAGPPDLAAVGDIMYQVQDNWAHYAEPSAVLLEDAALRVGNLETPVAPSFSTEPRAYGPYQFNAPPEMLVSLPVDILQLNNNHSLDVGDQGLLETVDQVELHARVGIGLDDPLVVDRDGVDVGLFAYTWGLNDGRTSEVFDLNVVRFGQDETDIGRIRDQLEATQADRKVVFVHWGFEYEYYPDPHFMIVAREIIAAGADLVVGHGPHVVQPAELCYVNHPDVVPGIGTCSVRTEDDEPRTAAVLYSLGDFGTDIPGDPTAVGLVGTATFAGRDVTGLGWAPVASVTEQRQAWVRPLEVLLDQPHYLEELERIRAHLGTSWER
ncbi:MAG: CapA family protein [Alphaproteobacteria bacterium]|nr:CapA family protein [Alphaproteobacteria bacterium]